MGKRLGAWEGAMYFVNADKILERIEKYLKKKFPNVDKDKLDNYAKDLKDIFDDYNKGREKIKKEAIERKLI